jgi:hypothetical protein
LAGRKGFVAGEILTAADVNSFLMDQSVMVFDDSTARGSAIPTPSEGMVTYRKDTKLVEAFNGSAFAPVGRVLQVVSTTKRDPFSANILTGTISGDVTGLTATITPTSTNSKILVTGSVALGSGSSSTQGFGLLVYRNGSLLTNASSDGGNATTSQTVLAAQFATSLSFAFYDSPSTTSATTYSVRLRHSSGTTQTAFINRDGGDNLRGVSTITAIEVAG